METESRGIFLLSHEVPNIKVLQIKGAVEPLNITRMRVHAITLLSASLHRWAARPAACSVGSHAAMPVGVG